MLPPTTPRSPPSRPRSASNVAVAQALSALQAAALAGNSTAYAAATKDLEKALVTIYTQAGSAARIRARPWFGRLRAGDASRGQPGSRAFVCAAHSLLLPGTASKYQRLLSSSAMPRGPPALPGPITQCPII